MPGPDGGFRVPVDYKFFAFGDRVPAVQVIDRARRCVGWFDADWNPRDPVSVSDLQFGRQEEFRRPARLGEMLEMARAVGRRAGTFLRVDLYDSVHGPVFGETAVLPNMGRGIQPAADVELGALWSEAFADAF